MRFPYSSLLSSTTKHGRNWFHKKKKTESPVVKWFVHVSFLTWLLVLGSIWDSIIGAEYKFPGHAMSSSRSVCPYQLSSANIHVECVNGHDRRWIERRCSRKCMHMHGSWAKSKAGLMSHLIARLIERDVEGHVDDSPTQMHGWEGWMRGSLASDRTGGHATCSCGTSQLVRRTTCPSLFCSYKSQSFQLDQKKPSELCWSRDIRKSKFSRRKIQPKVWVKDGIGSN